MTSSPVQAGRHILGAAAIALGAIALVWGDFARIWHPVPASIPQRGLLAYAYAVCFLASGLAVQWRRTARAGLVIIGLLYSIASALWLRRVIGFPQLFGTWSGLAEQLIVVLAAAIAYESLRREKPRGVMPRLGRPAFGVCAIVLGMAHYAALKETASMVPSWVPLGQRFWAMATGAALSLAGASILADVRANLAAWLLTALLMSFGIFVWLPSVLHAPHSHAAWAGNAINLAAAGASWIMADHLTSSGAR